MLILGHGASGTAVSMRPWVRALERLGVPATAIDLPRGRAERAVPIFENALTAHPGAALGGHSFGGRVASMVAADHSPAALVLLSYPLHRPGHTDTVRTEHWSRITCPVLLLSGESDPFARLNVLRAEVERLSDAELITYPRTGHGLLPRIDEVAPRIAEFLRR